MNLITALALFGAGYIYNEKHSTRPKINYSYTPYKNEERTISQYFKNLAMDKMDLLFYGGTGNRNNRKVSYKKYFDGYYKNVLHTINVPIAKFSTKQGAWSFIDSLCKEFERYGNVTVDNYYQFAGGNDDCVNAKDFMPSSYTYTKYGWKDADTLYSLEPVLHYNDDWTVELPQPEEFEREVNKWKF